MNLPQAPYPTAREALFRFIDTLYNEQDLIEIRPIETWCEPWGKQFRPLRDERRWLRPHEVLQTFEQLYQLNREERANILMGINPRSVQGGGKKEHVAFTRAVWADLDGVTIQEVEARWMQLKLPSPSIIVSSGNGIHLYWLLSKPHSVSDTYCRSRFEAMLKCFYKDLGADSTCNVAALLRLPGFWNMKNNRHGSIPTPCRLLYSKPDRLFPLAIFEPWFSKAPHRLTSDIAPVSTTSSSDPRVKTLVSRLDLPLRLTRDGRSIRSERDFAIICELLQLGLTGKQLWPLVRYRSKFRTNGRRYFDLTLYAAAIASNSLWAVE